MKKIFLYAAALPALAVACNTIEIEPVIEDQTPEVQMITEVVSGRQDVSTKSTIDGTTGYFAWSIGDNIAVHVSDGVNNKYVFTSDPGASGASHASEGANFTVVYEEGYSRDAFALFPSTIVSATAANFGQSGTALDVTLPDSYTLDLVRDNVSPCPMIAANEPATDWEFRQLCGLLRLTVNNVPPAAKRLEIDFDGKQVCGDFVIASPVTPGTSVIETSADASHDVITITKDRTDVTLNNNAWLNSLVLNIPLPTGTYTSITVTAYDKLSGGNALLTSTSGLAYTAKRKKAAKKSVALPVFSVSSSKVVTFAPGNLQASTTDGGANWTWKFADHQYDAIGAGAANNKVNGNGTISVTSGTVDLFGRSTSSTYFGISNSENTDDYTGAFIDWGTMDIDGKGANYWFTLSEKEWQYLLGEGIDAQANYRHKGGTVAGVSNALCTKATVNGVKGFIIFPDYYNGSTPSGVTWDANYISPGDMSKSGTTGWGATITLAGWTVLEGEGCVFVPAGGRRKGSTVYSGTDNAVYWSSNAGKALRVDNSGFDPNQSYGSNYGFSVRLAHEL